MPVQPNRNQFILLGIKFSTDIDKIVELNYVIFYTLKTRIPRDWITTARNTGCNHSNFSRVDVFVNRILLAKKTCKCVYDKFMYDTKRMNNELKCSNSLRIHMDDNLWKRVYTIYRECTLQSKLRSFQYKLLHRALPIRVELYRYGITYNELCVFCHLDRDTLEHLFCYV